MLRVIVGLKRIAEANRTCQCDYMRFEVGRDITARLESISAVPLFGSAGGQRA
jgi:hypothetical protein